MNEIIYGIHPVQTLISHAPDRILEAFILKGCNSRNLLSLIYTLKSQNIIVKTVSRSFLDKKSEGAVHQGIVVCAKIIYQHKEIDLPKIIEKLDSPFLLILDGITDPHNLGACLRNADAFGVHAIIIPKDRSVKMNSTTKKVACGAAETIPLIRVTNLVRTISMLIEKHIWILGATGTADHTLYEIKMNKRMAIVMGSEGKGLRYLTRKYCDKLACIPMIGNISSINVSVAAGIFLFEAVRQRNTFI